LERPSTPYLLKNVSFAVSNLCRGNHHAQIIQPFLVALVNNLHRCEDLSVDEDPRIDILWALLHIVKAGKDHVIALVNTGAIPYLVRIVERHFDNKKMLIPTLQCICSIVDAENNNGVDSLIETGFLQHALLLLNSESVSHKMSLLLKGHWVQQKHWRLTLLNCLHHTETNPQGHLPNYFQRCIGNKR